MYDEIMQELWPKFEADFKKYAEHGPYLAKVSLKERKQEAMRRLKKIVRLANPRKSPDEMKRLVFREISIFIFMLYHLTNLHKDKCGCSYCHLFGRLVALFSRGRKRGEFFYFFDTGKNYNGDVGFRLSNYA